MLHPKHLTSQVIHLNVLRGPAIKVLVSLDVWCCPCERADDDHHRSESTQHTVRNWEANLEAERKTVCCHPEHRGTGEPK